MFIEYKQGEKHVGKDAEISETPDSFRDCGRLLNNEEVVIDIDHLPKDSIRAMIKEFDIRTMTVWTDRGAHLYFKKPVWFKKRHDGICELGFEIEQHTSRSNPNGMTVKRNGKLREIENPEHLEYLPRLFMTSMSKNGFQDLNGMQEGDGRNKALFNHRKALNNCAGWEKILNFINHWVFAEPLDEKEYDGIVRDMDLDSEKDDKFWIANETISELKTVMYAGEIWWFRDGQYQNDEGNQMLIRRIYQKCDGKTTSFIDEVVKQIQYRSKLIKPETVFPIRFRNGILRDGTFTPIKNYEEFTPFFIDVDYDENAKPVPIVDAYIDELTSKDPDYRKLLGEVLGYVMITDPQRIRSLGKFFMFRGDGANGKGTLLQIMKTIYGPKNCTNLSIKQMTDDRFKVTMVGKLANLGDDIEPEAIDNNQLKVLKNISTADTVTTRKLYSQSESVTFTVKLYFTTNSDIKSFEKGYAYRRRIVWLPMFNKVEKPDPNFISKMTSPEALKYWVKLLVDGYMRLYKNQAWTECKIVEDYNKQYHEENDYARQFAEDIDPDTQIIGQTMNEMREAFNEWNDDDYGRRLSAKQFKDAVWDLYQIGTGIQKVNGKTRRVFMRQSETSQKLRH